MRAFQKILITATIGLLIPLASSAQSFDELQAMSPEERKAAIQSMSDEDRSAARE